MRSKERAQLTDTRLPIKLSHAVATLFVALIMSPLRGFAITWCVDRKLRSFLATHTVIHISPLRGYLKKLPTKVLLGVVVAYVFHHFSYEW